MAATFAIRALVLTMKHLMGEGGTGACGCGLVLFFPKSSFVVSALYWKFNAARCNSEIQHWVLTLSSGGDFF